MKLFISLLFLFNSIILIPQDLPEEMWNFKKPQGGNIKLQDLLGKNYYDSGEKLALAFNDFSLQDGYKTEGGDLHYLYVNLGYGSYKHILSIELNVKDSTIIQVVVYVVAENNIYKSWKKHMLTSGFKTSDMFIKMEGEMDEYFNDKVHAVYVMSKDLDPFLILYSMKDKK